MAQDPIHQIISKLNAERARLRETVAGISAERLEHAVGDGQGWRVREVLAHLANAEADHRQVAERLVAGEPVMIDGFELDRWNEARVAERAGQSMAEILADLERERAATLAFIAQLSPDDLEKSGNHPALGEVTVGKLLRIVGLHERMHQRDIATALDA